MKDTSKTITRHETRRNSLPTVPILISITILSDGFWRYHNGNNKYTKNVNGITPAFLAGFAIFFLRIEYTIAKLIASGSKSNDVRRRQFLAHICQVFNKTHLGIDFSRAILHFRYKISGF